MITPSQMREFEILDEFKSVLNIVANWMAVPLFMLFWVADLIYVPDQKWTFLLLRLTIVPVCFIVKKSIADIHDVKKAQRVASIYAIMVALPINIMIMMISDPATGYYAGLNLVAFGGLSFIPFSIGFFTATAVGIYLPYFLMTLLRVHSLQELTGVALNSFFIVGSLVICFLIRYFNENLRVREINSRLALKSEIANRDHIIQSKTQEAVRLNTLSNQFSPQVVRAIREGKVDLEKGVHRAQICAIFVDIVGSTERVVRLDQSKVDIVLARFMDTVVSTFLKYDLTIDKFQGDGILAFANDPIQHGDFIQRTCFASLEVRAQLLGDREFYLLNWKKKCRSASVSPRDTQMWDFTEIKSFSFLHRNRRPSPLCFTPDELGRTESNSSRFRHRRNFAKRRFRTQPRWRTHHQRLRRDQHIIFELTSAPATQPEALQGDHQQCPHCPNSVLYLDTNPQGLFVMKCHECGYELANGPTLKNA